MFNEFHHQVRGRGHEQNGTRGQDRTAYLSQRGVQVLCLADGAGSAEYSEFGAQAVVEEGCALLAEHFPDLIASTGADEARQLILERLLNRLTRVADQQACAVPELASTFLAVAVSGDSFIAVHVGDGVIGYVKQDQLQVISTPDNEEFANQTTFVTSLSALGSIRLYRGKLEGVAGFIMMSDGTSESLYDFRSKTLAPACAKLVEAVGKPRRAQSKSSKYKKRLRKLVNTRLRSATKDDCSLGVLGLRA